MSLREFLNFEVLKHAVPALVVMQLLCLAAPWAPDQAAVAGDGSSPIVVAQSDKPGPQPVKKPDEGGTGGGVPPGK